MILYYLILGVALAMSIATWALVRWCNQLVQLNEQTALQNANLWRVREDLLRQRGQIERASRHWYDLFCAERRDTHAQRVEIAELQQQLEQHQAASGYRKSGESVDLQRQSTPVAPDPIKGNGNAVLVCPHPVDAVKWNPGNEAYQCHCCGTRLYLHEDGGRCSFSENEPKSFVALLQEIFKTHGAKNVLDNVQGKLFGGDHDHQEESPWAS